jgi:hypothetical protein
MTCFHRGIDPARSNFLTEIIEDAWSDAHGLPALGLDPVGTHGAMVRGIVEAVDQGERDPARLRSLALDIARTCQPHRTTAKASSTSLGTVLRHFSKRIALMAKFSI